MAAGSDAAREPTMASGKICYVEIPAMDIDRSAAFYGAVFGWEIRRRGDGVAFNDTVNQVSGAWVTGRKAVAEVGLLVYIMVFDMDAAIKAVIANGGRIVQPVGADVPEITARFADHERRRRGRATSPIQVAAMGSAGRNRECDLRGVLGKCVVCGPFSARPP